MSDNFVGEIRLFPYNFAPYGWLACDGSLQSIANYNVLYALIGTTYGGDGQNTFGLPDLRGRVAVHQGTGPGLSPYVRGEETGTETVTLNVNQLGGHNHYVQASTAAGTTASPAGSVLAQFPTGDGIYADNIATGVAHPLPTTIGSTGSNAGHDNCAPTLVIMPCIATEGIYPSQS